MTSASTVSSSLSPVIFGLEGLTLTDFERAFLRSVNPVGIILFARNIDTPDQVRALTGEVRTLLGRDLLVLIDQEGGRVRRLRPPHWPDYPPMGVYHRLLPEAGSETLSTEETVYLHTRLMAADLYALGINVDCLPVLDVPIKGAHDIIGDRALGDDVATITGLGRAAIDGLMAGGVLPVIKHIPGHGRALVDSHEDLPRVDASSDTLAATDFAAFTPFADTLLAMTAHVVYSAIDADQPATLSQTVINTVIRGQIGFQGLLMTDDLSMKALGGDFEDRTARALAAGCDLILHCNGDPSEMRAVAAALPRAGDAIATRIEGALAALKPDRFDMTRARVTLDDLIKRGQ